MFSRFIYTDMENQIIYWRMTEDNRTAALDILLSKQYNATLDVVMESISKLQTQVWVKD